MIYCVLFLESLIKAIHRRQDTHRFRTQNSFGNRSFAAAVNIMWNSLALYLWQNTTRYRQFIWPDCWKRFCLRVNWLWCIVTYCLLCFRNTLTYLLICGSRLSLNLFKRKHCTYVVLTSAVFVVICSIYGVDWL